MTPREDLAWAAGLFEGEGCITIQKHKIRLQLASSDRDVVERFASVMGIGSLSGPVIRPTRLSANPKPLWFWISVSSNAELVLRDLLPYLGKRRRERAEHLLALRKAHVDHATRERTCDACGFTFRPTWGPASNRVRFCSASCQQEAARARARQSRISAPRCCAVCATTFQPARSNQIHCSKRCRDALGKRRQKEKAR